MLYNYNYDIASLICGLFLLTVYILRKTLRTRSNKFLYVLINVCVLGSLFDLISCFSISYPNRYPMWFNYFTCYGYLFFYNSMGVLFLAYVDSKTKIAKIYNIMKYYINIIIVVEALLIFTSPFTHWVSYFDENKVYTHGPMMVFLYVVAGLQLFAAAILFLHEKRRFNKYQVYAIVSFIAVVLLGVLIQILVPRLLVGQFGCSLVLFFIYTSLENPVYYTYRGTICYNRRAFLEIMKIKRSGKEHFGIFAFAIKDYENYEQRLSFKDIGRLSSGVAEWLSRNYKENAFCLDDDQFIIIMDEKSEEKKIRENLSEFFSKPIVLVECEVLLDINTVFIPSVDIERTADIIESGVEYCLSKRLGEERNFNFEEVLDKIQRRRNIANEIKKAISEDLFEVYYQPIRNVQTGKFTSSEALIRLKSSEYGYISPEEFIPIAENDGLISEIGEIVFEKVCKFIRDSKVTTTLGVRYIEINLSPIQCAQPDVVRKFRDIMDKYDVVPFWINLEITETASMQDGNMIIRNINSFHNMGVSFSVDDYGSGFASAEYLYKLPVEIVKIDKSILWQGMDDVNAGIVLTGTLAMLKSLGKKIVVEGVENQAMVDLLTDNGCDYMQGYFYSKPIPADQYVEFLKENS